ncbi:hypothetical protein [Pseudofrankia sp. BMG5.36]|nr:hypothetical protein [Pseudofrankia sp. BMG5.36]
MPDKQRGLQQLRLQSCVRRCGRSGIRVGAHQSVLQFGNDPGQPAAA